MVSMMTQHLKRIHRSRPPSTSMSISARTRVLTKHYLLLALPHIIHTIRENITGSKLSNMTSHLIALRALAICGRVPLRHVAIGCTRVRRQMEVRESKLIWKLIRIKLRRRSILLTKKAVPTYLSSMFGRCLIVAVMLIISRNLVRRIQSLAPDSDSVTVRDKARNPFPIKIRF